MKAAKIVQIGAKIMELMSNFDLKLSDYKFLELYSEYVKACKNNEKRTATILFLSEKYHISESSVKRIIRRFEKEI